tara:strand:- start:676 stop:1704 length:1029 start_codon:yes stop_codon:yes gene_type:complete
MNFNNIDLNNLSLNAPKSISGNYYFTKLSLNSNIRLNVGNFKKKITTLNKGDNFYYFKFNDIDEELFLFLQSVEDKLIDLLYNKSESWFENKISIDDIKNSLYGFNKKEGKNLCIKLKLNCENYDYDNLVLENRVINIDDLNTLQNIIPIINISGIKFNTKNFYIIAELKDYQQEEPVVEEPVVEEPVVEEPVVEEPVVQEPVVEEPVVEEPVVEEPVVQEPVVEEPVVQEPVVEEPVVEEKSEEKNEESLEINNKLEEVNIKFDNLEKTVNFDETKNILKLNENRLLFYKLYVLFSEQIKTHEIDLVLGKLNDLNINYSKFIDFLNQEEETYLNEDVFTLV